MALGEGGSRELWRRRRVSGHRNNRFGRMLPRTSPLLSDSGKAPAGLRSLSAAAAFHLAHYQDGNLSVTIICPLSPITPFPQRGGGTVFK